MFKLNVEKKPDIDDIINVAILETSYLQIKKPIMMIVIIFYV
ncbi:toxin B domain protein [Escherichia coli DEC12B]|nr:toxin B domain protein [Escherichia coli DEC1D]EHX30626.1 toxin B domain protein [Escherichia coli DEC12B]